MKKRILDMCCGSRMFYFDKHDPNVLFTDIREYHDTLCDGRKLDVQPDMIADSQICHSKMKLLIWWYSTLLIC